MNSLSRQGPFPSMLIRLFWASIALVEACEGNWLSWSPWKFYGRSLRSRASSRASARGQAVRLPPGEQQAAVHVDYADQLAAMVMSGISLVRTWFGRSIASPSSRYG